MPTAAKLIAGLSLGLTALVAAYIFTLGHPEFVIGLKFYAGNFMVGFFGGWYSLGRKPGYSHVMAMASGIRSLVLILVGSGMLFSTIFIFGNLENNNFRDPMDLPLLWVETSFNYVVLALSKNVIIALLIGGILSGIATFQAALNWR
ncbi:MAG: TrgA family protein [Rhodobacteraceae bacterium]|nr:TrgA family protein [Paracoccaceae bacterium]